MLQSAPLEPLRPAPFFSTWPGWLAAIIALGAGFLLYQSVSLVLTSVLLATVVGAEGLGGDLQGLAGLLTEHPNLLLAANAGGQVVGLGLFAVVLARLTVGPGALAWMQVAPVGDTKRLASQVGWSVLGWGGLIPVVGWVGQLNERIPLPESIRAMEEMQTDLLNQVLGAELGLVAPLITVALVPALCEELFFRGYVQRVAARSFGGLGAVLVVGVAFGFYHLRLSQVLPLSVLGIYMGYVAWRTRSLWPAIVVHLLNNGTIIVAGALGYGPDATELAEKAAPAEPVAAPLVVAGVILAALVVARMERERRDAG